ncbi:MAG: hypothetical protein ABI321_06525 [Polyangia bacterium]
MSDNVFLRLGLAALGLTGCNLVAATGLQTDYSLDAIAYASPTFGDPTVMATMPTIACSATDDTCSAQGAALGASNVTVSCDTQLGACIATAEIRVSETIDVAKQTSFPSQAIQFGVDAVEVKRLTYWINKNQLNLPTPVIDFYVAPTAAHDETDPAATLLTSIATIAAGSNVCGDPAYVAGDPNASGSPVCSAPLPSPGKSALSAFVKDYKTPFQIIAHTRIVAHPGDLVPSGSISFDARPTVGLKILD